MKNKFLKSIKINHAKPLFFSFLALSTIISLCSVSLKALLDRNLPHTSLNEPPLRVLAANDVITEEDAGLAEFPKLDENAEFPIVSARSVMAIDLDSGVSLYEKDPDVDSLPASTTKIMTAVIAMEHFDPGKIITIKENGVIGQKMGLEIGESITVDSLMKGLLIASANDAAEVLARNYEGGREEFVKKMNEKVVKLRLTNTFFKNPSGLDEKGQTTTARDLMKLSTYVMQKPYFTEIVGTKSLDAQSIDGKFTHRLINTNELLGEVEGVLGTKTGWTENAKENLVTYVEREGKRIIVVLLGSQDRFGETEALIEWIFDNYKWIKVDPNI